MCRPTPKTNFTKCLPIIILFFTALRILAGLRIPYMILADQRYDDRMLFEQAGLPVEQTPARWVTDEQAAALSHAGTSQTTTFNLTAVLLGLWLAGVGISAIRQRF